MYEVKEKEKSAKNKKGIIYISDSGYFKVLCISIESLREWHPDISVVVYDVGLSERQKTYLIESLSVRVIEWWPFFRDAPFRYNGLLQKIFAACLYPISIKKRLYIIENLVYNSLKQGTKPTAELITAQKPFVMLHATDMLENHDILMMDADTAVIGSLSEILETRKIYKILSREKHFSPRLTKGDCRAIYTGLVFIGGSKEEKKAFLHAWIKTMANNYEPMSEQTALTRLLQSCSMNKCHWRSGEIISMQLGENIVPLQLVECERYAAMDEETREKRNSCIVHFKAWRHHDENLRRQCSEQGLVHYWEKIPE